MKLLLFIVAFPVVYIAPPSPLSFDPAVVWSNNVFSTVSVFLFVIAPPFLSDLVFSNIELFIVSVPSFSIAPELVALRFLNVVVLMFSFPVLYIAPTFVRNDVLRLV